MATEPLSIDDVAMLVLAHMRGFAARAAQGDATPEETLRSVSLEFLRLVDGKVEGLPAFTLLAQPHPDDMHGPEAHFVEEALPAGMSDRYMSWDARRHGRWEDVETGADGAYTSAGMETMLFGVLRSNEDYWLAEAREPDLFAKTDGVAFSNFVALDGHGMVLPGFDYLFETPAAVAEWRESKGLRPLPPLGVISTTMHDGYHRAVSPDLPDPCEDEGPGPA